MTAAPMMFDNDGRAMRVTLDHPLRGTSTGACVSRHLARARVPVFTGPVKKTLFLD